MEGLVFNLVDYLDTLFIPIMNQENENDPAILYIIIGKFARSTKPTVPEHDAVQKEKEEQKVEQKVMQSNKPTICDVKACCQHMNITEFK